MKIFLTDYHLSLLVLSRSGDADDEILKAAEKVQNGKERIRIIRGCITDEDLLREAVNEVDIVIHMAAKVNSWGYFEDFEKVNIQGTKLLVAILSSLPASVEPPRFIHISSFTALLSAHYPKESLPDWAPYSKSKCLSEDIVLKASLRDVAILRLGWLWGNDDNVLLPKLYDLSRNPIWKISPTAYPISTQHIKNACEAVYCATISELLPSIIYEFQDPEGDIQVEDFTELYVGAAYDLKHVSRPFSNFRLPRWLVFGGITLVEWIPLLGYGKKWVFEGMSREPLICLHRDLRLDATKAREEIGYVGQITRKEGLTQLAENKIKTNQEYRDENII
ncbi:hypothetical protein G9A89_013099 [Geosiphon pyriformis]|nr:hypothetical protein G9A89_013099 [Geosiphon pyriformis]